MIGRLQPIYMLQHVMLRTALVIFWSIVIAINIVLLSVFFLLGVSEQNTMILGGTLAVYVFMYITGVLTFKDTFPLALSMGSTRYHYFVGTQIYFFGVALLQTVILSVLGVIEAMLQSLFANVTLYHFRLPGADTFLESFVFNLALLWLTVSFANVLAAWAYRVGRVFWFGLGTAGAILFSLALFFDWFTPVLQWFSAIESYWIGALYALPLILIFILLSWLPARRAEVKKN